MISIIISLAIVFIAGIFQIFVAYKTQSYRNKLKGIFPKSPESDLTTQLDEDGLSVQIKYQNENKKSEVFQKIVDAINNYLKKNKGAADYSTLKDITDRQCDAVEAQISATAPVPIYIGLCGTVIGIVFGVGVLAFGGGLDSLLTIADADVVVSSADDAGTQGIKTLLQGVAVAMITTFIGVFLTIFGSWNYKRTIEENEERKNRFLNWMHGELLPQMKHNMASTLNILQKNLSKFNKDFASNSQELNRIFSNINTSYRENTKLLEAVQKLDVDAIASANIRVLEELKGCTGELNDLHLFLDQSNRYLSEVESLNGNLNNHLERTKMIEKMAQFFQDEIQQISVRKSMISKAVGDIDLEVQKSIESLSEHTGQQYGNLKEYTEKQHLEFMKAIEAQQKALNSKLEETSVIVDELKNLVSVKESLSKMVDVAEAQNEKMDILSSLEKDIKSLIFQSGKQDDRINYLSEEINGISMSATDSVSVMPTTSAPRKVKFPLWAIVTCSTTCFVVIGSCIVFIFKAFGVL